MGAGRLFFSWDLGIEHFPFLGGVVFSFDTILYIHISCDKEVPRRK